MEDASSDDELDWDVVDVPMQEQLHNATTETAPQYESLAGQPSSRISSGGLEITLKGKGKQSLKKVNTTSMEASARRMLRLQCHKIHTIALLANATNRNKWINDPLLRARLMSLTPLPLQNAFLTISGKREPEAAKRGRIFEANILRLTQWWYENFEVVDSGHIVSRTFNEVERALKDNTFDFTRGEIIRSSKSLMKHALMHRGSRDISAQLFTSLCRALGIPARLIVSLQSVPWQAKPDTDLAKAKSRWRKTSEDSGDFDDSNSDEDSMAEAEIRSNTPSVKGAAEKGNLTSSPSGSGAQDKRSTKGPVIRLRKSKPAGNRLGSSRQRIGVSNPPTMWTEVFSRPDGSWIPVDPVRYIVNKRKVFHPPPHERTNRMVYVVAIEEDGYARDVTPRYAPEYAAKTAKMQLRGKGRQEWWGQIMALVTRPFRLHRDDVEDQELEHSQMAEGMPTSLAGFKDHPIYVLERHLKRDEVIFPKGELGKFRGETVFHRSNVVTLKTAENWLRRGRQVIVGAQPMKWVKQRSATIQKRRVLELAQQQGEEMLQALYAETQTEVYIPPPVVEGKVPKNEFGNIDFYVPSMLPMGAAYVPYKGALKIARQLGFDYAEAVTAFEFRKGSAFPVITGIVVAAENEAPLLDAYREAERIAEAKEREKNLQDVTRRWVKLVQGLRIHHRLQRQYGNSAPPTIEAGYDDEYHDKDINFESAIGGYLPAEVVQPFELPRYAHGTSFLAANTETGFRPSPANSHESAASEQPGS